MLIWESQKRRNGLSKDEQGIFRSKKFKEIIFEQTLKLLIGFTRKLLDLLPILNQYFTFGEVATLEIFPLHQSAFIIWYSLHFNNPKNITIGNSLGFQKYDTIPGEYFKIQGLKDTPTTLLF